MEKEQKLDPVLSRSVPANGEGDDVEPRPTFTPRKSMSVMDAMNQYLHARGDVQRLSEGARTVLSGSLGIEGRAAYAIGADSTGGVTVPEEWSARLVEVLTQFGVIEGLAETITTTNNGQLHIDRVVEPAGSSAAILAEGGTYTESEDTFEEVLLDAYKYGHLAKASDEMVEDSQFDLNAFVQRRAGRAIALKTGADFAVGDGSGKPNGIMNNTAGVTLATGNTVITDITSDNVIDLYHSLPVPYRTDAVWILHDSTLKVIRKLREDTGGAGTGNYLWQPGLQAGQPDRLLGRPVYIDPNIATSGTSKPVMFFGDVARNYVVRAVTPVRLKVLTELYAGNGYIGFRVDRRVDGDIQDASAGRTLKLAAS